MKKKMLKSYLR